MRLLKAIHWIFLSLVLANCSIDVSIDDITGNDFLKSTILATSRGVGDGQTSATIVVLLKNSTGKVVADHKPSFVFIDNTGASYEGNGVTYSDCAVSNSQGLSTCVIRSITIGPRKILFNNIIIELVGTVYFDPPSRKGTFLQVVSSAQVNQVVNGYLVNSITGVPMPKMIEVVDDYTVLSNTTAGITPIE